MSQRCPGRSCDQLPTASWSRRLPLSRTGVFHDEQGEPHLGRDRHRRCRRIDPRLHCRRPRCLRPCLRQLQPFPPGPPKGRRRAEHVGRFALLGRPRQRSPRPRDALPEPDAALLRARPSRRRAHRPAHRHRQAKGWATRHPRLSSGQPEGRTDRGRRRGGHRSGPQADDRGRRPAAHDGEAARQVQSAPCSGPCRRTARYGGGLHNRRGFVDGGH